MATITPNRTPTPLADARERAKYLTGLLWHIGAFVIMNAFFWILDLGTGGMTWAFWITGFWGLALAFHVLAWAIDGRRVEDRRTQHYLRELEAERDRGSQRLTPPSVGGSSA